MLNVQDANGHWVAINEDDLFEAMAEAKITLLGLSMEVILEFRYQYEKRSGPMPVTVDSIREIFSHG